MQQNHNNMEIDTIISLIISQGIPVAEKLWKLWANKTAPTQADWDELKQMGKENAMSQMRLALIQNGIDLTSPQGVAILALTT
jgi:hypothetical protein